MFPGPLSLNSSLNFEIEYSKSNERRSSSQVAHSLYPAVPAIPTRHTFPPHLDSSIYTDGESSLDSSEASACPFLNSERIPEFNAVRDSLRDYFRTRNRFSQLKKKPWIFIIQFLKIVLITVMLTTLTTNNYKIRRAMGGIKDTLSNLMIKDYDKEKEHMMIYSFSNLDDIAVNAAKAYLNLSDTAVSLLGYPGGIDVDPPPIQIELKHLANVSITDNWTVDINDTVLSKNSSIHCPRGDDNCVEANRDKLSIHSYMYRFVKLTMKFELHALLIGYLSKPHCVSLNYSVYFHNAMRASGLTLGDNMEYQFVDCKAHGDINKANQSFKSFWLPVCVDLAVGVTSAISMITMILRFRYGAKLFKKTKKFIEKSYDRKLNNREKHLFVNYWHICILIADAMLVVVAGLKLLIDCDINYPFDTCTLMLGIGVWLSYLGLLRYLLFDKHYSMLLNTMVLAIPHLCRFIICVAIIFMAYLLSGWLVLSPYCTKFATIWTTMETLFSLLNGDDMFATFSLVRTRNPYIKFYSRIYLYSFVCFFIYVVLSLCICIIEDAYTVISSYKSDSCPWIRDCTVFPEFVTSWEEGLKRSRIVSPAQSQCQDNGNERSI